MHPQVSLFTKARVLYSSPGTSPELATLLALLLIDSANPFLTTYVPLPGYFITTLLQTIGVYFSNLLSSLKLDSEIHPANEEKNWRGVATLLALLLISDDGPFLTTSTDLQGQLLGKLSSQK